jgi:hypothetical protein
VVQVRFSYTVSSAIALTLTNRYKRAVSRHTPVRTIGLIAPDDLHPIDVTVPGSNVDPRLAPAAPPGVVIHHVPALHPEDVVTLPNGLRVTSVARTLIDLAEDRAVAA